MILLDTSVVIDALRNSAGALRPAFIENEAAICGVTRAEVLHGARTEEDFVKLAVALDGFPRVAIPESLWDPIGQTVYELRTHGVSVPFADAIIATVAMENAVELWTRDAQFQRIQAVLPQLKLFPEPP